MLVFRRKESRTRKAAPLAGIGNLIAQFLAYITGNHSRISGKYRFNAQFTHTGYDLLLKHFLLLIPTIRIRPTPSFQIIHLPPGHKSRAGNKFIDFFRCISDTLQQIVPNDFHPGNAQRHINAVHCHPVYLLLPTLPIPKRH